MFYVQMIWLDSADDVNERPSTSNAVLKVRPVQDSSVAGPSAYRRIREETSSSEDKTPLRLSVLNKRCGVLVILSSSRRS